MLNKTYHINELKEKFMENYNIIFYDKENGTEPAKDFILTLEPKMIAKILRIIDLLEINGPELKMPYIKQIDNNIYEIRAKYGSDITRVLYFFTSGKNIILTNGFKKKTQKTPPGEVKKAIRYRKDYLRRHVK
jgi:phage-related protein